MAVNALFSTSGPLGGGAVANAGHGDTGGGEPKMPVHGEITDVATGKKLRYFDEPPLGRESPMATNPVVAVGAPRREPNDLTIDRVTQVLEDADLGGREMDRVMSMLREVMKTRGDRERLGAVTAELELLAKEAKNRLLPHALAERYAKAAFGAVHLWEERGAGRSMYMMILEACKGVANAK